MIDNDKRKSKEYSREKQRQRMHVQIDEENYEYIPMYPRELQSMHVYQQTMKDKPPPLSFKKYTMKILSEAEKIGRSSTFMLTKA